MKKNSSASKPLTKQDLIETLKEFKTEFKTEFRKELMFDIDTKLELMELRIEDRARERHSEVLTRFDGWAGELETAREDRVITTKQLKDHEKRIKKLERIQN
jgi:YesN/AraC family two-component response regulator